MEEKDEVLMQNVTPEDLPTEAERVEKPPFVPSPKWKRVLAWILFVIVIFGIITWLLNIAYPEWIDAVKNWAKGLF